MDSLANQQNAAGRLNGTNINFFGPAINVNNANKTLSSLQNQNTMSADQKNNSVLRYMSHVADPIGGIIGWNDATGGTIPMGSSPVWERLRAATGRENTSHNLYFVNYGNFKPNLRDPQKQDLLDKYWSNGNTQLKPATR